MKVRGILLRGVVGEEGWEKREVKGKGMIKIHCIQVWTCQRIKYVLKEKRKREREKNNLKPERDSQKD